MISKEYGNYTLICDICGDSFQDAIDARQGLGWKSKRVDGEWTDICPDCIE